MGCLVVKMRRSSGHGEPPNQRRSTGDPSLVDRPFLPFDEVAASPRREDRWNVFRILGGSWIVPAPRDRIDPQHALHAMLNRRRPRGTFALHRG
jgi:hypothetical protein